MENYEFEKLIAFNIKEKLKYVSNTVVIKHILNEKTGNIMALAVDYGKVFKPGPTPFSTFIKVIEGKAEVVIDDISTYLLNGYSMIIPGHTSYTIEANQRFKMLSIILKTGYDSLEP
ncbi:MAG: cupin [Flavobacteriaceae bacterium]|nr:cupin [Mangrovimonas sp.]MCB0474280.1 cupin [Flavobacteriaceae bacterium]